MSRNLTRILNRKQTHITIYVLTLLLLTLAIIETLIYRYKGVFYFELGASWDYFTVDSLSSSLYLSYTYSYLIVFGVALIPPLMVSDLYFLDRKQGVLVTLFTKESKVKYFLMGALSSFVSAFVLMFFVMNIYKIYLFIVYPYDPSSVYNVLGRYSEDLVYLDASLLPHLAGYNMYLYNFVIDLLISTYAGLVAGIAYAFSMQNFKNKLVAIGLPGVIIIISGLFSEVFIGSKYTHYNTIFAFGIKGRSITTTLIYFSILIFVFLLLFICGLYRNREYK